MMNLKALIKWSCSHYGHLPWRQSRSLYSTLVSEIMLQQTTVGTVLNHYHRFLKRFPSIKSLAMACEEDVLIEWKGLGYYRRAKNLRKACIHLWENYRGQIPLDFEKLIAIPGIGEYTANALLAIGGNKKTIALDANLERVIARLYGIKEKKGPKLLKHIYALFDDDKIFSHDPQKVSFRHLNEALMDLGRTYCQSRKTRC